MDKLLEKMMNEEILKTLNMENSKLPLYTNSTPFENIDWESVKEKLMNIPPVLTKIEMYQIGYDYLKKHIEFECYYFEKNIKNTLFGTPIYIVNESDDFLPNEIRFVYSDSSDKKLKLFKFRMEEQYD